MPLSRKGRRMPKEQINYPYHLTEVLEVGENGKRSPEVVVHRNPSLCVHWTKDQDVQISIEYDIETLRDLVAEYDKGGFLGETEHPDRVKLYTPPFERSNLQKPIRVTKRARDDVFGADE